MNACIFSIAGFLIKPIHKSGCEVGYVTHTNPRGKIPPWITNKISSSVAPRMLQKLHKACLSYPEWKSKHRPNYKYWLNPEQMTSPRISLSDVSCTNNLTFLGKIGIILFNLYFFHLFSVFLQKMLRRVLATLLQTVVLKKTWST